MGAGIADNPSGLRLAAPFAASVTAGPGGLLVTLPGCRFYPLALVQLGLILVLARSAHGQIVYEPEAYRQLADVTSQAPPPGTRITAQNWQNYRRFLPLGMQAAY